MQNTAWSNLPHKHSEAFKDVVRQLEEKVYTTPGLTVVDKRESDGFTYALAVQQGQDIYVVYTTLGLLNISKSLRGNESCWVAFKLTKHIPFSSVPADLCGSFVDPYRVTLRTAGVLAAQEKYGLLFKDLPFFLN